MIVGHAFARLGSLPGTAPAHALHVHLPREVKILMKGIAVPVRDLGGGVTGLASRALAPQTVLGHVDGSALAVTCPAPLLPMCDLGGPGRGPLDRYRDHRVRTRSRSDRSRSRRLSSCLSGNSGSTVEPAPAVAGSSIPRLTPSLPDLARLFLSLSGSLAQLDVDVGSLFTASGVTGAG